MINHYYNEFYVAFYVSTVMLLFDNRATVLSGLSVSEISLFQPNGL